MMAVVPNQPERIGNEELKRDVSVWGLLWASEGSMIGSGWLFAALLAPRSPDRDRWSPGLSPLSSSS